MFADLRVPVERAAVELLMADGTRHSLVVFHAPGQGLETFTESDEPFFPAREGETMRLFSRASVAVLSSGARPSRFPGDEDLPETRRAVCVHLRCGEQLSGELRYVPSEAATRPIDYLNEPSSSFMLFGEGRVHHIAKAHVSFVDELGRP